MTLAAAGVALLPGIHSWWSGRGLLARTTDPAFPELLLARGQQRAIVAFAAGVLVVALAPAHWSWTIPLLVIGQLAGGFSFRKALYGETWTLFAYLRFSILSVIGAAGFWLMLGVAPRLVVTITQGWAPDAPVIIAALLASGFAALLLAWEAEFPRVWLALHGGSPLDRPDLRPRIDDIVRRSGVTAPTVARFGAPGSYVMNAVALPSSRRPGVAFSDSLLERLEEDEILAVFAHEVGHLEHYDARRISRLRWLTRLLILGGLGGSVAAIALVPAHAWLIGMLWPAIVLAVLVQRIGESQKHEADSDRRSAELMGDPEPMVRALTKLHHYSKLPRRWPYDFERSSTHPSLARRIQALRALAQRDSTAGERVGATVLRSTTSGAYIVLDATRIYWLEGVTPSGETPGSHSAGSNDAAGLSSLAQLRERAASYRATAYAELVELRVGVSGLGRAIHARDRAGRTSSTPLHPDDVAVAQEALDRLDGQLAVRGGHDWRRSTRMIAALLGLLLIGALDLGWAWIPVAIALVAPSAWSLAAAGVMTAGRVVLAALAGTARAEEFAWVIAALAVALGTAACIVAWRWATSTDPAREKRVRQTLAAAAAAIVLIAVQAYRGRDARLEWASAPADVIGRFDAQGFSRGVHLSPAGTRVAIQMANPAQRRLHDDEDAGSWRFVVSDVSDSVAARAHIIDALAIQFLDEDRILALRLPSSGMDSLELVIRGVGVDSSVAWSRTLPYLAVPSLDIDRSSLRWTVTGHDMPTGEMVIARGGLDSTAVVMDRRSYDVPGERALHAWSDGSILSATMEGGSGRMVLAGLGLLPYEWTIASTRNGPSRAIGSVPGVPDCTADGGTAVHCVVTGTKGSTLWRIDDGATLTLLGTLPRDFDLWRVAGANRVVAAERGTGALAVIDAGTRRGILLAPPDSTGAHGFMLDAATAPGLVAALTIDDGRAELTLYRVP